MQAKVQNLEITYKVEINHLNNKLELLSKKVHMLEAKLKSEMKCPENSISGLVKEVKVTANEEETESKQNMSSSTFAQNVEKSVMIWRTFQINSSKLIICSIIPCKALV